ncbi:fibronectin type III domain-containing protein [Cytobacillus gottheilii]|uniref:fibronectin type III domain-containing protein n=1 Tax=Cytobacillus gottheilii TaxID=859144 RepID=UPI000833C4F1|nr:fibronectin type III domain-containing protein [Cytobacillus gottheilii]
MKKKLIATLFILAAVLIIPITASASNYDFKQGDYVELNGYLFVVLNPSTDYLFYDGYLENRRFSSGGNLYSTTDTSNVGYYLNRTFLNNLGGISEYIPNKSWAIYDTRKGTTTNVTAKVGLISVADWKKYSVEYGNGLLPNPIYSFWSRDRETLTSLNALRAIFTTGVDTRVGPTQSLSVRPAIYLSPGLELSGVGTKSNPYKLTTEELVVLSDITDLSLIKTTPTEITLNWKNPTESNFSHLNIYKNGEITKSNYSDESFTFTNLNPSETYTLTIKAVDLDGVETDGISMVVSTDDVPLVPEVKDLNVSTTYEKVNLSWKNPESEFFNHVKIYRKVEGQEETASVLEFFQPLKVSAAETDDFSPMFETNGSYWNDLTVEPETTYSYKLTTVNDAEVESEGTIIEATTGEEPAPEIVGGGYTETDNGDFLYEWTQPTTGKVKILVDGEEYQTVDASLKEFVIPKEDMKYDIWKNPKVTLVPVSDSGKEGSATKPPSNDGSSGTPLSNVEMPFTTNEFVSSGMMLLAVVAPFVLLMLAFRFVPKVRNLIMSAFGKGQAGKQAETESRESTREPRGYRREK